MKRLFAILALGSMVAGMFGQSPEKMSYQAVIRNTEGVLVQSSDVGIKISILQGSADGNSVYTETHAATTNANGLVTLEIGTGTSIDDFASIDWANGPYFIKTETNPNGGISYTIKGTNQLLSVPYALYAKTTKNGFSGNYIDLSNKPDFSKWDKDSSDNVTLTGNDNISGNKTFSGIITIPVPVNSAEAVNKFYVDNLIQKLSEKGAILLDAEGNIYSTVRIGSQIWMAENLKTTRYRNGDAIGTTTTLDITGEITPKYQWAYAGNESNVATYGRLYTWYAVTDSLNVCPTGWHVPTNAEWITMENYLISNGYNYDGTTIGNKYAKALASATGWNSSSSAGSVGNTDYPGKQNATGFTAFPGGYRDDGNGSINSIGRSGSWWSSSEYDTTHAWAAGLDSDFNNLDRNGPAKDYGFSVRCIRD